MAHIHWESRFDTGISIIDQQHRRIVDMINDLHDASIHTETKTVDDILHRMRAYVSEHFQFEEELMFAADYEFTEAHIQLHRRFTERLNSMAQRHEAGESIIKELSAFLTKWVLHHIGHEDMDYVEDVSRVMKDICL
ncbi:MAG: bacteriohemerythrin [Chromatiales bacterium]|nr:bacteriohemerythrin [Chromatiales bacterium]